MKICFLNQTIDETTGAGYFVRSLLDALKVVDPELEYAVLTQSGSGASDELPLIFPSKLRLLVALPQIRRILRRFDIIHALDGYPFGVVAALANFGLGKKLVITAIGTGALKPVSRPLAGRLLRWAYRRADAVTAVSNYTRRELLKVMPDLDIAVVNHGVNLGEFSGDALAALGAMERARIENLRPYILSVGALKPRKGFQYSLTAFSEVRKIFPSLRYVIVGDGERREIDGEIRRLKLGSAVVFLRRVSRPLLRALYHAAELFILLPYNDRGDIEGFGLVFLEAAASGLAVIGTRDSGAADATLDGKNGFLVPSRDARAAAEAAIKILSSPVIRTEFSQASRSFARSMHWSHAAGSYQGVYRRISSGRQ